MDVEVAKYFATAMAIFPLFAVALALGNIFSTAISSIGRNPGAQEKIFPVTILGFALTEAIGLFALLVAFLVLFG